MNISSIGSSYSFGFSDGQDEEHLRIIRRLRELGLPVRNNKSMDKATLHEYELRQVKNQIGANGKGTVNRNNLLTVSSSEIEQIKMRLKDQTKDIDPEEKEKKEATENREGATQVAKQNAYFFLKRKQKNS